MLYAIMSQDHPGSAEQRSRLRPDHLARLQALLDRGRLVLAGPHPAIDAEDPGPAGMTGSLVVAEFDSLEEARAWASEDPFVTGNVYESVLVKPFKKVMPA